MGHKKHSVFLSFPFWFSFPPRLSKGESRGGGFGLRDVAGAFCSSCAKTSRPSKSEEAMELNSSRAWKWRFGAISPIDGWSLSACNALWAASPAGLSVFGSSTAVVYADRHDLRRSITAVQWAVWLSLSLSLSSKLFGWNELCWFLFSFSVCPFAQTGWCPWRNVYVREMSMLLAQIIFVRSGKHTDSYFFAVANALFCVADQHKDGVKTWYHSPFPGNGFSVAVFIEFFFADFHVVGWV